MIDKPITSKLALLLYNVYKVNYCTCLAIQELEEKAKKYDEIEELVRNELKKKECLEALKKE